MGLFSFLKKAGENIFGKSEETKAAEAEALHAQKLLVLRGVVEGLGYEVDNFSVELDDDTVTAYGEVESQEIKEKIILALGNVSGIATVDDRINVRVEAPAAVFYEVQSGDSLSKIAKHHYGDAMKYPVIFEANRPMLSDPDKIYPGQVLRIPAIEA